MLKIQTIAMLFCAAIITPSANAQSTISDQTWEMSLGKGFWGVLLPSHEHARLLVNGGASESVLQSDGDSPGAFWELGAIRRFEGTRTSLEARGFFALALANSNDETNGFSSLDPVGGGSVIVPTTVRTHMDADTYHWGFDIALRDTWRTCVGGLSAGLGLSQMAFNQNFVSEFTPTNNAGSTIELYDESVDSYYLGGIGFVGWDGYLFNRASNVDLTLGYYNLDSEYEVNSELVGIDSYQLDRGDTAFKIGADATTRVHLGGHNLGLTLSATYISDITVVNYVAGTGAVLDTDDAVLLNAMVEWLY